MKRQVFAYEQKKQEVEGTPKREGLRSQTKTNERTDDAPKKPASKGSEEELDKRESAKALQSKARLPAQQERPQYKIQSSLEHDGRERATGGLPKCPAVLERC